ncbi:hypothetical protein ACFLRA_03715 [Bdellovibrionota bacterium]
MKRSRSSGKVIVNLQGESSEKEHKDYFEKYRFKYLRTGLKNIKDQPYLLYLFINATLVFIGVLVLDFMSQPLIVGLGVPVPALGVIIATVFALEFLVLRKIDFFVTGRSYQQVFLLSGIAVAVFFGFVVLFPDFKYVVIPGFILLRVTSTLRYTILPHLQNQYIPSGARATTISILSMLDSILDILIVVSIYFAGQNKMPIILLAGFILILIGLLFPAREARKTA